MSILYLIVALIFATLTDVYDTVMSVNGIKAGVAVEANLTWIYGTDKPSALQYYAVNLPIILLTAGVSIVAYFLHSPEWYFAGLVGPVVAGILHIRGGRDWAALGVKF